MCWIVRVKEERMEREGMCHKEVQQGRRVTKAEAVTGPNNKEVKMGSQVVRKGLYTAVWCDCGNGWCNMISYKENNRRS